ncbi:MAG: sortase [Clostridia bacterium]|nr:sortase [Clostridia bacterium]
MKRRKLIKYVINTILLGTIFATLICILIAKIGDNDIKEEDYTGKKLSNNINEQDALVLDKTVKNYPKEEILDTYKGYKVCAKLEIPSIPLKANILSNYSKKALKVSCTKFWGVNPNENGNFCIAGHNTKSMFSGIKRLEIGNTFFITDSKIGKVEYEIFNIDKVAPNNVDCLDPITKDEKEVTLITCTNDSTKRVIIKAREKI